MDISENRIPHVTAQPGSGNPGSQDLAAADATDATLDAPIGRRSHPMFCMPSAGAIADAIIRRTLSDIRG